MSFEVLRIFSINKNNLGGYEKVTIVSILFLPLFSVFAQEQPFYYYHGRKIALKASTSEVYVKYREGVSANRKLDALKGIRQLTLAKDQSPLLRALRYELAASERSEDGMKRILATLRARPDIEAAFPCLHHRVWRYRLCDQ